MLNARIYRAASLPLLAVIVLVALSLGNRATGLTAGTPVEGFDSQWTLRELNQLAQQFPIRRPGSPADDRLAHVIAQQLGASGSSGAGFKVQLHSATGPTIDGEGRVLDVVAQRAGATGLSPIVLVAHRDAAGRNARAALSGTAVLLELGRILADQQTNRTIVLISTSGGSGGLAGAEQLAAAATHGGQAAWSTTGTPAPAPLSAGEHEASLGGEASQPQSAGTESAGRNENADAVLVLGDLASASVRQPVIGGTLGADVNAPESLLRTAADALGQYAGIVQREPGLLGQIARQALPLSISETAPFNSAGLPSIQLQVSGDDGPTPAASISPGRIEALGTAILSMVDALDAGPTIAGTSPAPLHLGSKTIPDWALRLLVAALLLPALVTAIDGLARLRRRREPVGGAVLDTLSASLPFLGALLTVALIGAIGLAGSLEVIPTAPGSVLPLAAAVLLSVLALALGFAGLALRRLLRAHLSTGSGAGEPARAIGPLIVLLGTAIITWFANPLAALLLAPAVHLWLPALNPDWRPRRRIIALGLVLFGLCGPIFLTVYTVGQLDSRVGGWFWVPLRLLTSGQIGPGEILMASLTLGCSAVAARLASTPLRPRLQTPAGSGAESPARIRAGRRATTGSSRARAALHR